VRKVEAASSSNTQRWHSTSFEVPGTTVSRRGPGICSPDSHHRGNSDRLCSTGHPGSSRRRGSSRLPGHARAQPPPSMHFVPGTQSGLTACEARLRAMRARTWYFARGAQCSGLGGSKSNTLKKGGEYCGIVIELTNKRGNDRAVNIAMRCYQGRIGLHVPNWRIGVVRGVR
jgi:hypothetical protein